MMKKNKDSLFANIYPKTATLEDYKRAQEASQFYLYVADILEINSKKSAFSQSLMHEWSFVSQSVIKDNVAVKNNERFIPHGDIYIVNKKRFFSGFKKLLNSHPLTFARLGIDEVYFERQEKVNSFGSGDFYFAEFFKSENEKSYMHSLLGPQEVIKGVKFTGMASYQTSAKQILTFKKKSYLVLGDDYSLSVHVLKTPLFTEQLDKYKNNPITDKYVVLK